MTGTKTDAVTERGRGGDSSFCGLLITTARFGGGVNSFGSTASARIGVEIDSTTLASLLLVMAPPTTITLTSVFTLSTALQAAAASSCAHE